MSTPSPPDTPPPPDTPFPPDDPPPAAAPPTPVRRSSRRRAAALAVLALVLIAAIGTAIVRSTGSQHQAGGSPTPTTTSSATPPPPRPTTTAPAPDPANIIWRGDLESGDLSQYAHRNFAHPPNSDRAVVYSAQSQPSWPAPRQGLYAVRLSADNGDVEPLTPSENPRSQLDSPVFWQEGDEAWLGWSTYFPADFPTQLVGYPKWFTLLEIYGEPYNGSGALTFSVETDNDVQSITLSHNGDGAGPAWSTPLVRGGWHDFVIHTKLSRNANVGYVELWYDGQRQRLLGDVQRLMEQTSQPDVSDHNFQVNVTNYRAVNVVKGRVTIYQDAVTVGRSYAAVAPRP